ncbi:hypothetical protein EDF73_11222 [Raoultella sp. BIGb0138]|nr:hypothetical protein EDF73_11222 [Raoultella sp. BIGb0138]
MSKNGIKALIISAFIGLLIWTVLVIELWGYFND